MIYPEDFELKTGFDRIRQILEDNCLSSMGRKLVNEIRISRKIGEINFRLSSTYEFQQILRLEDYFPSEYYYDISVCLNKIIIPGSFPDVGEVFNLKRTVETAKAILNFFKRKKDDSGYTLLKSICSDVKFYPYVLDSADRIIDKEGNIRDSASQRLKEIRSDIAVKSAQASKRLNSILKQAQNDGIVEGGTTASIRNGRGVIPVNAYDKRKIKGLIHDQSATGKTVFIEPSEIVEINNEIFELEYEEKREIVRILTKFADDIRPYIDDLFRLNDFIGEIDFIRAKALLGNQLGSIRPAVVEKPGLMWRRAVHPLLFLNFRKYSDRKVIPLDIILNEKDRIILISGPNAGGKSVCLKTVGLLQYMLQCGLTIPVGEGSESGIFNDIYIDIGDEQSIENDLSTYSSHLINMKFFVKHADNNTLVLIDEFGTGTEPMLGGSLAEAILDVLNNSGCYGVITTHYTNLKHFASLTEGITNGAMLFDHHLMQPLFQLSIGKPGSSFAFEIARKIGLPAEVLDKASLKAGIKNIDYDRNLRDIARDKRYWENKRQNIRKHEKRLEELIEEYEKEITDVTNFRQDIIKKAKNEAESILNESNRMIENTIRQIRESQAAKETTKEARQSLEKFKTTLQENLDSDDTTRHERIDDLTRKVKKIKPALVKKQKAPSGKEKRSLAPGDAVRISDTMACGEIIKIENQMAHIETGSMRLFIPVHKIERISRNELRRNMRSESVISRTDPLIERRKLEFKPEIDIRGFRGDEAVNSIRNFLDDAVMVQHHNIRILHGKGNGILRQLVREYLSTVNFVSSYRDEHVDLGGSGITVVVLDF